MNLGQARAELQARGFDQIDPDRLDSFLNFARNQFEDAYAWPWLEATATGPAPLTISDLKHVLYVVDASNQRELVGVPASQIISDADALITRAGVPEVWWLDGEEIVKTYPVSTSAQLSVRYVKESPELAADGESPLIPARYHQTWVDLAAVRAHLDNGDSEQAASVRAIAGQDIAQIINRYETRNRQNAQFQVSRAFSEDD